MTISVAVVRRSLPLTLFFAALALHTTVSAEEVGCYTTSAAQGGTKPVCVYDFSGCDYSTPGADYQRFGPVVGHLCNQLAECSKQGATVTASSTVDSSVARCDSLEKSYNKTVQDLAKTLQQKLTWQRRARKNLLTIRLLRSTLRSKGCLHLAPR